ncbi:MAG: 4Fe-4S dicluster domain-containing protein [Lachnospiraceae bacterium]|nr:4Fe-4S dicluster domain-containing protein [Lachnospiraceae bacterium]
MELFKKKKECCGCSICMSVCPVQAITMQADEQGFLYPHIDDKKCIHCGKCERECSLKNLNNLDDVALNGVLAVINKDEKIRMSSSSGGFFYTIAEYVLQNGGTVYGAMFDENYRVLHKRGTRIEDICRMQGSKYVQSNTNGIFELVKKDILDDKIVLFTGCPCQIDGLNHYLKGYNQEKLITCDLICHGVNSPRLWEDYLSCMKKKDNILDIHFREKTQGWKNISMHIKMEKKTYVEISAYDYFYQAFFSGHSLRPVCFSCPYASLDRKSDITMGDFWGIENVFPEIDDDKGVSLILLNSYKGRMIFEQIKQKFVVRPTTVETCMQPSLKSPVQKPISYDAFWADYMDRGYGYICKKYFHGGIIGKVRRFIKTMMIRAKIWNKFSVLLRG